jgi:hypothetical protein
VWVVSVNCGLALFMGYILFIQSIRYLVAEVCVYVIYMIANI